MGGRRSERRHARFLGALLKVGMSLVDLSTVQKLTDLVIRRGRIVGQDFLGEHPARNILVTVSVVLTYAGDDKNQTSIC